MIRFRTAGLVTFGTTPTLETACSPTAEPVMFGPCRRQEVGRFFVDHDLLLMPTLARLPLRLGEPDHNRPSITGWAWTMGVFDWCNFTPLFNTTGQPAIGLPLGMARSGLPIGSQFVGRMSDEASLLRIGAELEASMPWRERTPPVHAAARA